MRRTTGNRSLTLDETQTEETVERRANFRIQTVMRIGHISVGYDEGLVLVKNLSDHGARLRIGFPLRLGDVLTLALSEDEAIRARVMWSQGKECGLRFDDKINCMDMLSQLSVSDWQRSSRPLRLNVSKPALVRCEAGLLLAAVEDISHRGMKIRHDGRLTKHMVVKVTLPSGIARTGVVRWSRENLAGVLLLERFCAEDLGSSRAL